MATRIKTFANDNTADGGEVENEFNEIYTNITNSNLSASAGIVISKMALSFNSDDFTTSGAGAVTKKVLGCRVYLAADQNNFTAATFETVQFDTESYDVGADFNTGTYTYTVPKNGKYLIQFGITVTSSSVEADKRYVGRITRGGSQLFEAYSHSATGSTVSVQSSAVHNLTAADAILLQFRSGNAGNTADLAGGAANSFLDITYIGE